MSYNKILYLYIFFMGVPSVGDHVGGGGCLFSTKGKNYLLMMKSKKTGGKQHKNGHCGVVRTMHWELVPFGWGTVPSKETHVMR